jgi:hypothetical protein
MDVPTQFSAQDGWSAFAAKINRVGERGLRTSELLGLLGIEKKDTLVLRLRTRFRDEGMSRMEKESNPEMARTSALP